MFGILADKDDTYGSCIRAMSMFKSKINCEREAEAVELWRRLICKEINIDNQFVVGNGLVVP